MPYSWLILGKSAIGPKRSGRAPCASFMSDLPGRLRPSLCVYYSYDLNRDQKWSLLSLRLTSLSFKEYPGHLAPLDRRRVVQIGLGRRDAGVEARAVHL